MDNKMQEDSYRDIFESNTFTENVSMIKENDNDSLYTSYTYEVRVPKQYKDDFMVQIRASDLKKIRKYCYEAKNSKLSWNEILLSVIGLTLGATISAIISKIPFEYKSFVSIFSYNICPLITVGLMVWYWNNRKENMQNINDLVDKIEECIIDPDKDTNNGRSDSNEC